MQVEDMIKFIEKKLAKSGFSLSEVGIEGIKKRFKQKEDQGGFSNYWKEVDVSEVMTDLRTPEAIWFDAKSKIENHLKTRMILKDSEV